MKLFKRLFKRKDSAKKSRVISYAEEVERGERLKREYDTELFKLKLETGYFKMTDKIEIEDCNINDINISGSDIVNPQIVFSFGDTSPLILSKTGFTYLGEEIKDAGKAYELYIEILYPHSLIKDEKVDL